MGTTATTPAPTFPLDSTLPAKLTAYYAEPPLPQWTVANPLARAQDFWNFFVSQNIQLWNQTQFSAYAEGLASWMGETGAMPTTPVPAPPGYRTSDCNVYYALLLKWNAAQATAASAFDPSAAIEAAPLPPAPTITNAPVAPDTPPNVSLVGAYIQGVWLATPFAVSLAQAGIIVPYQTVIQLAASPTGYVKYVPLASFNGAGIWYPCPPFQPGAGTAPATSSTSAAPAAPAA